MTELLDQAIKRGRALSPEARDDLARMPLRLAGDDEPVYRPTPEEETDLAEAMSEVEYGEPATDEQARAIRAKHDL